MVYGDDASVVMMLWWCYCDDATRLVYFIFNTGRMAVLATPASMMCCLTALLIWCCYADNLSLDADGMVLQTQPRLCLHEQLHCELLLLYSPLSRSLACAK
jgi:hypothetical protein